MNIPRAFQEAHTLPQLLLAARNSTLADGLKQPASLIIENPALERGLREFVSRVAGVTGVATVADLLGPGRVQGMLGSLPGPQRARLVEAARQFLLSKASGQTASMGLEQVKPSDTALPLQPTPRPVKRPDDPPDTLGELQVWAESRGVADLLSLPAATVGAMAGADFGALSKFYIDPHLNLGALIAHRDSERLIRRTFSTDAAARLRTVAWQFLQDETRRILQALDAEEAARANPPPPIADTTLQQLVDRLSDLRAVVRESVLPRKGEGTVHVQLYADPLRLHVGVPPLPWERGNPLQVTVDLETWSARPLSAACSCPAGKAHSRTPGTGACRHVLAAVEAAIRTLRENATNENGQKFAESLREPPWARVLRSLDKVQATYQPKAAARDLPVRLSWKLGVERGHATLTPQAHKPLKKGGFSAGARMAWNELAQSSEGSSPADRRAIAALFPEGRSDLPPGGTVPQGRVYRALARLAGSTEVSCADCGEPITVRSVRLGMTARPAADDSFTLVPGLEDEPLPFEKLFRLDITARQGDLLLHYDGEEHVATMIEADAEAMALARVFAERPVPFPRESFGQLFVRAQSMQERLPIALPEALRGEEVPPDPGLVVRLQPMAEAGLVAHVLSRPLVGGATFVPGEGPRELLGITGGRHVHVRREPDDEVTRARALIGRLGFHAEMEGPEFTYTLEQADDALDLVAKLQGLTDPELMVEWPDRPRRVTKPANVKHLNLRVTQGKDWFGLEGEAQVDGARIELAVLLDALRRRRRYVQVKEGMWLTLSDSLREKLTPLADQASGNEKSANLSLAGALAVEELAAEVAEFEAVAGFSSLLERIRQARTWEPKAPKEISGILRDYQHGGFTWLARLASWGAGAVLADDMGLGKTIQALALLAHRGKDGPALVVAPTSVCGNWIREAQRFTPSLRPVLYREIPNAERASRLQQLGPKDVLVTSYGLLVRDVKRFAEVKLGTLVLDEAQAIKNADTLRSKAARTLSADFKLALTGTPLENHLGELWSLYRVIFPGLFGSWDEFRERFVRPEPPAGADRRTSPRATLARQVRPFLLRRTKQEVAPELPPRTEMEERIDLSPDERRLYEDARLAAVAKLTGLSSQPDEQQRFEVLAALTRLRLCASHPAMYDATEKIPSSKLSRFLELVTEIVEENHRALVFSQFTKHLALVREALDKRQIPYLYLDGQTPPGRRDELVNSFQSGGAPLFLISLKAGGTGLNLTGADYVLHLDPWWNPAVEDQATDRAHRIGQTRPVTVVRLVARGTIEEQILSLHAAKRSLVADVLEGSDAAARISTTELIDLIRAGATAAQAEDVEVEETEPAPVEAERPVPVKRAPLALPAPVAPAPAQRPAAVVSAPPPPAPAAPPPAAPLLDAPTWLWERTPEGQKRSRQFEEWLEGRLAPGSVLIYRRAAGLFMSYAVEQLQRGTWTGDKTIDSFMARYLQAVESGAMVGPRSMAKTARVAFGQLREFVRKTGGDA